jgi:uncharacterized protein (DUF2141 family)
MREVSLEIHGVELGKKLYVAIHTKNTWLKRPFQYIVEESLSNPFKATIHINDGIYAIAVFEDIFESGEIVFNFWNIPKNPIGFSRNPHLFGKPNFDECSFEVKENKKVKVVVYMKNLG